MKANINDIIFSTDLKGATLYNKRGIPFICTGICKILHIYDNGMIKVLCFSVNDKKEVIKTFKKKVFLQDNKFVEYNINEELSKAMKDMINRYEQVKNMKNKQTKIEVLEYCNKVEKNINVLITIKRYTEHNTL